jgi:hypothetical protein
MSAILTLRRLRQEDCKFEASYLERPCLKKQKQGTTTKNPVNRMKRMATTGRKYLQTTYPMKDQSLEHMENSQNSIV